MRTSIGDNGPQGYIYPQARLVFTRAIGSTLSDTEMHVPMFHPGTPEFREARAIDVEPGALIRNVDIQADPVPALHVRGTVTGIPLGTDGKPVDASVGVLPVEAADLAPLGIVAVDRDGSFSIPRVRPGLYALIALSPSTNLRARMPIEVLDRDHNGVRVELRPPMAISGNVIIEGAPGDQAPVMAVLRIGLMNDPVLGGFRQNNNAALSGSAVTPAANGSFRIVATAPGPYSESHQVVVVPLLRPPSGWNNPPARPPNLMSSVIPMALENAYVKSIHLGDADVLRDGLRLTLSDSPRDPLVITLGTNAGTIEGRVLNANAQPAGAATVALIPQDDLRFRVAHKHAVTDAEGKFQIQGIAPGDYKLFAWEQVENGAWQDPEFMSQYEQSGTVVRIKASDKATVEVRALPR